MPKQSPLAELEENLTCPICHNFFNIPVSITPCHHTFCSECIRSAMRHGRQSIQRAVCPQCRVNTDERQIVPNWSLEKVAKSFLKMREDGFEGMKKGVKRRAEEEKEEEKVEDGDLRRSTRLKKPKPNPNGEEEDDDDDDNDTVEYQPEEEEDEENDDDISLEETSPSPPPPTLRRKPPLHYHGLKRKKLAQICAQEGLNPSGTFEELRDRHLLFTTLYNAECDSQHPKSITEILAEVSQRERAKLGTNSSLFKGSSKKEEVIKNLDFGKLIGDYKSKQNGKASVKAPKCIRELEAKCHAKTASSSTPPSPPKPTPVPKKSTKIPKPSSPAPFKSISTSSIGPWSCPTCTYYNKVRVWTNAKCEMCDGIRPKIVVRKSSPVVTVDCT